jgi:hypothetical protein
MISGNGITCLPVTFGINMKITKYLILIIIASFSDDIFAGFNRSGIHGFGIELGVGYNRLLWSSPVSIMTPGGVPVNRTDVFITPTIRVFGKWDLLNHIYLQPLFGYNQYGGRSDQDKYTFHAMELGLFALYKYSNLAFGLGLKLQRPLSVQYHISLYDYDEDRSDWFVKYSGDAGIRVSYVIRYFCMGFESWFGISNLADGPLSGATVHESHYRVMIGYHF